MCIAIYKPAGKIISKESLAQCFKTNPDGAGFMYAKDKELYYDKGFFTFDEFYEEYSKIEQEQCLIHFRIKTHGPISVDNCHPFMVNKGLGFIHNGIIGGYGSADVSDTRHFNAAVLKPLVSKYGNSVLQMPAIKDLIESRIGYSKLAFLDRHGNYELFNEDKGVWDNDIWYSNNSYKPPVFYPVKTQPYLPKPKLKRVEEGELVVLNSSVYDFETKNLFKKDEVFEVVSVNSDYTADLLHEDGKSFVYNVSFAKFDFYEVATSDQHNAFDTPFIDSPLGYGGI
jgi:glutamine amidotransferase